MRLLLAAALLLSTATLASAQGLPGAEYQTFQCKVFNMGCKPPLPVATPVADEEEQQAAPPPTKVKAKRKPKPKPKVQAQPKAAVPLTTPAAE